MNRRSFLQFLGAIAGSAALPAIAAATPPVVTLPPPPAPLPPARRLDLDGLLDGCIRITHPDLHVEYLRVYTVQIKCPPPDRPMTAQIRAIGPFKEPSGPVAASLDCSGYGDWPVRLRIGEVETELVDFNSVVHQPVQTFSTFGRTEVYRGMRSTEVELDFLL